MPRVKLVTTEPNDTRYIEMISDAYARIQPTTMVAAVAYATHSGVADLVGGLSELNGWNRLRKRWLVGIDFCRSDPVALDHLNSLPRSEARIYDGDYVVGRNRCNPRVSYHPKLYGFHTNDCSIVVAGSGNLSHAGLCVGVEAGISAEGIPADDRQELRRWFDRLWRRATPWTDIAEDYADQYNSQENLRHPVPTEDDAIPESAGTRGQLTAEELRRLSICNHLWIQAGNLHANRGAGRPGNQLMLKRNTRVFFGFPARDLVPDTFVGYVTLEYAGNMRHDCSLRFSNNSMDVLTLPVPGTEGPSAYDQETLCFERVGVRHYRLTLGVRRDEARWRRQSQAIDGHFRMSSGREWGVF